MSVKLPRNVITKRLKNGATAFYFNVPTRYRKLKCPVPNEPLGKDFSLASARATILNEQFDEWDTARKGLPVSGGKEMPKFGSVDWLFREYRQSKAYLEKVSRRSRPAYEWEMQQICDARTLKGDRVGSRPARTVSPRGADKLYDRFLKGPRGLRPGTAEKMVKLCRKAWRVVHRLYPDEFDRSVPNPWIGVTLPTRVKDTKPMATRQEVYAFAHGCIAHGGPREVAAGATAVICFEWLQRPENVVGGYIKWSGYRNPAPTIRVEHHKTGAMIDHPLEDIDGTLFYADAEEILSKVTKRGIPMVMGLQKPYSYSTIQKTVQHMRKKLKLPASFSLDACRHGGMTELEEAELTEGQGRALSAHRTRESYAGYAKRTQNRMLSATRKRIAHRLANEPTTSVQNEPSEDVQNGQTRKVI